MHRNYQCEIHALLVASDRRPNIANLLLKIVKTKICPQLLVSILLCDFWSKHLEHSNEYHFIGNFAFFPNRRQSREILNSFYKIKCSSSLGFDWLTAISQGLKEEEMKETYLLQTLLLIRIECN